VDEPPPPIVEYQDEFARIERAVDAGDTDLAGLGFWKMVRRIKVERPLADHWAEVAGRIDRKAFEGRVRVRLPVWLGNGVLVVGTAALLVVTAIAVGLARPAPPSDAASTADQQWAGALVLVAGIGLAVSVHALAHWAVGRAGGIRFLAYFLGGPLRLQPGLKIDYASYLRAGPGARAAMHAAGAVASKLAPFVIFAWAYLAHRAAGYRLLPEWSLWALLGFGVLQVITDVAWSTRFSDWKKVRRELRVRRAIESARVGARHTSV
jgi:hypothetical protein